MAPSLVTPRLLAAVAATTLLAALVLVGFWDGPLGAGFVLWLVLCALGEMLVVRHPAGHATLSMAITANFAAMLVLPAHAALAAIGLSTLVAELAWMRKHPVRALFNASQSTLAAAAGIAIAQAAGGVALGARALDAGTLLSCTAGAIAYTLVNTSAVSVMIGFEHGIAPQKAWLVNFGNRYELLNNGALFSLGAALAILVTKAGLAAVVLVALPMALAWVSYKRTVERAADPASVRRAA